MKMDPPSIVDDSQKVVSHATVAFADAIASPTAGAYVMETRLPNGRPMLPKDETSFFQIALIAGVLWVAFKFAR